MSTISRAMDKAGEEERRGAERVAARSGSARIMTAVGLGRFSVPDAEQYQALASAIAMALPDNPSSKVVVFLSSGPGEGASTIAREYALTLVAHSGASTLLVDANLRNPSLHHAFHVAPDPGLSDHILADAPLSDVVRSVGIPHLSLLPAGRPVIAPPRVVSHERMDGLLSELRRRFAHVILDAAPILSFSEGIELSRKADGVVVVIRAGRTRRQLVARSLELLGGAHANVLGTVLNRRRFYVPKFVYDRV